MTFQRWSKAYEPALTAPSYASLEAGYEKLWATMVINPAKMPIIRSDVARIAISKTIYLGVRIVPWGVVGILDQMEAGGGAKYHLHNGDPLKARTVHVPAGRPPLPLKPPFTWLQSANDALTMQGLDKVKPWTIARLCYELEGYNGFGYRSHGIVSPYLWSYCQHYIKGKYVSDGKYNPHAVSEQVGAMPLLKMLLQAYPDANFLVSVEPITPPPTPPPVDPTPPVPPSPPPAPTPSPAPQPTPAPEPAPKASFFETLIELLKRLFSK